MSLRFFPRSSVFLQTLQDTLTINSVVESELHDSELTPQLSPIPDPPVLHRAGHHYPFKDLDASRRVHGRNYARPLTWRSRDIPPESGDIRQVRERQDRGYRGAYSSDGRCAGRTTKLAAVETWTGPNVNNTGEDEIMML